MRRNGKGQALTEFALILPLLLLLLLGIIEASRAIWAYITVQQAAREATRYAVTGRPYIDSAEAISSQLDVCQGTANEPDVVAIAAVHPWLCYEEDRVEAVKEIAISHGRNLNPNTICRDPTDYMGSCAQTPGAFGVFVEGQTVSQTITGTFVVKQDDYPGDQGLNIQVSTFYNLQMLTPIFDLVMGGTFVRLEGRTQLQNEGLDAAIGIDPPPGIAPPPTPVNTSGGGTYFGNARIISLSGYLLSQSDILRASLTNHPNSDTYDIYLDNSNNTYKICSNVATDAQGTSNPDPDCDLGAIDPPIVAGDYKLYSTVSGSPLAVVAEDEHLVTIVSGGTPTIVPTDSRYVWAANTPIDLNLRFHNVGDGLFEVWLYDPAGNPVDQIAAGVTGNSTEDLDWDVYDMEANGETVCDMTSGLFCTLRSFDSGGAEYSSVEFQINQPKIVLSAPPLGTNAYARGSLVYIYLQSHTPRERYNITVNGIDVSSDTETFDTLETNTFGDLTEPIAWRIPDDCSGFGAGWPDGTYRVASFPLNNAGAMIAEKDDMLLQTPAGPFLTVEGGYTWPAGSYITVNLHTHTVNETHYLEFNGQRVPAAGSTFGTGNCGEARVSFQVPPTLDEGTYTIASYLPNGVQQATVDIIVQAEPLIMVLEGDTVLPDDTITIQLLNHVPNSGYYIVYNGYTILSIFTDAGGGYTGLYNLGALPAGLVEFGNTYVLESQATINPGVTVAQTDLALMHANLVVTKVELPDNVQINSVVPVTLTVQNAYSVPINRWVDMDYYFMRHPDPDPLAPSNVIGYNFPGDIKYWKDQIDPLEEFTITTPYEVTEYGDQMVYGYVDTTNYVYEGEGPNEVANPDNINEISFTIRCNNPPYTNNFNQSNSLDGWDSIAYGDASIHSASGLNGDRLRIYGKGSSTNVANDDTAGGHIYFYITDTVSTAAGLDVVASVKKIYSSNDYAKAGIEIRDSLDGDSPRITWAAARHPSTGDFFLQPRYRQPGYSPQYPGSGDSSVWTNNHQVDLDFDDPLWLRLAREPGENGVFKFYYVDSNTPPPALDAGADTLENYWGDPVATQYVPGIDHEVQVGLFSSPYRTDGNNSGYLDDFSMLACGGTVGGPALAPGYQVCYPALDDRSFEKTLYSASPWKIAFSYPGTSLSGSVRRTGNTSLRSTSFDSASYNPFFYQEFTMPDWVISTTTVFDFNIYTNIEDNIGAMANQPEDKFYAVVLDTPPSLTAPPANPAPVSSTIVAGPLEVANGQDTGTFNPREWTQRSLRLTAANGVNLEDYAGQNLYLYLYNNSNAISACGGTCATWFYFEDANLRTCTTQPMPTNVSTRIHGNLTVHYADGSVESPAGVKVWAYAQDEQVYETFTIQGGEFNFYNLPADQEYVLFSQHYLVQYAGDTTQIEALANDTQVYLLPTHTDADPFEAYLALYPLPAP